MVLARTTRGLSGREVARLSPRGSQRGVLAALERLVDQGLVTRAEAGASFQYTLNREHLAAPAVEVITGMRATLWERLRGAVEEWDLPAVHVSVFGSAARGEGDVASDIDLLVVRSDVRDPEDARWQAQLAELADRVRSWTGNHAGIAELAVADLPRLADEQPTLADNLRADSITLTGPAVTELMDNA